MKAVALVKKNSYPDLRFTRFFSASMRRLPSQVYGQFYGFVKSRLFAHLHILYQGGAEESLSFKINLN